MSITAEQALAGRVWSTDSKETYSLNYRMCWGKKLIPLDIARNGRCPFGCLYCFVAENRWNDEVVNRETEREIAATINKDDSDGAFAMESTEGAAHIAACQSLIRVINMVNRPFDFKVTTKHPRQLIKNLDKVIGKVTIVATLSNYRQDPEMEPGAPFWPARVAAAEEHIRNGGRIEWRIIIGCEDDLQFLNMTKGLPTYVSFIRAGDKLKFDRQESPNFEKAVNLFGASNFRHYGKCYTVTEELMNKAIDMAPSNVLFDRIPDVKGVYIPKNRTTQAEVEMPCYILGHNTHIKCQGRDCCGGTVRKNTCMGVRKKYNGSREISPYLVEKLKDKTLSPQVITDGIVHWTNHEAKGVKAAGKQKNLANRIKNILGSLLKGITVFSEDEWYKLDDESYNTLHLVGKENN